MSAKIRKALCCECGEIRTCHRPRNYQRENWWLRRDIDPNWHRETGDLKCSECGVVTRHAILHPEGDRYRDHAEDIHEAAVGWKFNALDDAGHARIRQVWRQGRPENPYISHRWFTSEADDARKAGLTHFQAICKARIPVPTRTSSSTSPAGTFIEPDEFHDVDREDPETGIYWYDVDCVDCLNRWNKIQRQRKQKDLQHKLIEAATKVGSMDDQTVEALLAQIDGDGA